MDMELNLEGLTVVLDSEGNCGFHLGQELCDTVSQTVLSVSWVKTHDLCILLVWSHG